MKNIEVELISLFDKEKYTEIKKFLDKFAEDLGEDNKESYYFILPNKVFKVVNNISKKTAKIVMKLKRIGNGDDSGEEVEIFINPKDIKKAIKIFSELKFDQVQKSLQERRNYLYKNTVLELKYSESWGYHMELEVMINNISEKPNAIKRIHEIGDELNIHILTPTEQKEFAFKIDQKYKE